MLAENMNSKISSDKKFKHNKCHLKTNKEKTVVSYNQVLAQGHIFFSNRQPIC